MITAERYNELCTIECDAVVWANKAIEVARKEAFEEVFNDLYKLVSIGEKNQQIIVTSSDIKAIARRYGVRVKE